MTPAYTDLPAAYAHAVWERDSAALLAIYADTAIIYDMWEHWSFDRGQWAGAIQGWLGSLGAERVVVEFQEATWHSDGAIASFHAFIKYTSQDEAGTILRSMTNRISWTALQRDDHWQIVHEHTSAPIQMDGMNVLMER